MDVPPMIFADPALIDTIVGELKSQGTFDQFRKECIADVDTKPAYQNLHQRVESTVSNFLEGKTWRPDLNKNQLRDSLRKHIFEMGFLETGVERIVDQVVNPKVHSVFMPQVEDVVYRVQGIPKPEKKNVTNTSTTIGSASKNGGVFSQPPSFLPGLSFLPPALQNHIQKPPTLEDLLPTDLDPVSPESSKDSADESENMLEESGIIKQHDDSMESQLSGISDLTSHGSNHGESGIKNEDLNDDSQQSKISSSSKVSCVSNKLKTSGTKDHDTTPDTDVCQDEVEQTLEEAQENIYPTGPLVQYGDQYSMEEEVATTVSNINNETPTESNAKKDTNFFVTDGSLNSEETKLKVEENDSESECAKRSPTCELGTNVVDESSLAQSEDSQFSGSSDNKLLIDEMKDFNSQSGNSQQPEDEQSSMKTSSEGFLSEDNSKTMVVENVVEASEEARHGFEDSQDALERPPLPHTPPPLRDANERPPLPPDSSPEIIERPPLPRTPPFASRQDTILPPPPLPPLPPPPPPPTDDAVGAMESTTPPPPNTPPMPQGFSPPDGLYPSPIKATVKHSETDRLDEKRSYTPRSTTPTTEYPGREQPSTPPGPPPMDSLRVKRPPLPETPPLGDRLKGTDCPPLPPLPPPVDICEGERPPLPLTPPPPLAEKTLKTNLERPPTPQATILSRTPPPIPEEEFSRDSAVSYEEGAVPKTPHWEPETEEERPAPSSDEHLGISDAAKLRQSFSTSPKISNGQDEVSQSGSEEMQLAWSPLSNHGDEGNDDSGGKHTSEEKLSVEDAASKDPSPQEKLKRSSSESNREHKKDDSIKSESDKHKDRDHIKDGKSRERRKEDDNDRSRKDSSSSSKRHDDRSSKYRESSSRSKHDDKNRSDKDRDRHSSHHRSDDRRRDEKERSSSSRHKSSRSDDRHRHRDREQKHGSSGSRHEDRNHDKSSKSEDRSKSSKSSDRDRDRERDRDRDRKDSDRKERDNKDKEKKVDKDKERSRKDSSRSDEKKREKEREKEKRDKSSTICRPNNDRKSPDPDSNNGSTFGGNNHGSSGREDHPHDNSNQESNKGSGSTDSNSKSSDSSQQNNLSADLPSTSCNQSCSLSSSLPFKKRPLVTENEALDDFPCGQQIILKIKKFKKCGDDKLETTKRRKIKVVRRLEKEVIRNLNKYPRTLHQVNSGEETLEPGDVSPTEYFENDWPSKPNDQDFLAYIENLEQSKNLSGLSDWSETDSEDEEVLHCDDIKDLHSGLEERDMIFSLCLLPDALAPKFSEPKSCNKTQETNDRLTKSSNSIKATKRIKQRKTSESESGIKRHKTLSKDVKTPVPIEQKSRRARKPNKRYSNDEFTSHFDNEDELDMIEEEPVLVPCSQAEKISAVASCTSATPWKNNEKSKSVALPDNDLQEKENKLNLQTSKLSSVVIEQKPIQNDHPTTYSWNKDSYNSNSEDEMDSTNTESDLIGTALKNLMMESGLGGPDEVSGSQKLPSTPRHTLTNSLSAINTKTIPLSGVKRVGLSRNYKGNKKLPVKQSIASASCGQFSLPPSPESDVSASSCDKGSGSKLQGSKSDASDLDSNAESSKLCISRVKQHYSSDDLYKPRPPLRLTSKRAKAVTEQNGLL